MEAKQGKLLEGKDLAETMDRFASFCPKGKICGNYFLCMNGIDPYKCVLWNMEEGGYDARNKA